MQPMSTTTERYAIPKATESFALATCNRCGAIASVHQSCRNSGAHIAGFGRIPDNGFVTIITWHGDHRGCAGTVDPAVLAENIAKLRRAAIIADEYGDGIPTQALFATPGENLL